MTEQQKTFSDKILVTGVTGGIGKATVEHLLKKGIAPAQIIGLSRKQGEPSDLVAKGVEIRVGDYLDYNSLLQAFEGVDKIMLTSAVAFTDRFTQHYNVITAARQAGVKHIVYMAVMRKKGSGRVLPEVTESDLFTEQVLKSSGLAYTIVYHPPFTDALPFYYDANPYENGIRVPAGDGKTASATRDELAEAHATILTTSGHENKTYSLGGSHAVSFADIANILAGLKGKPVSFTALSAAEYIDGILAKGVPQHVAAFISSWAVAIAEGEFENSSGDLERLLGRKTKTFREYAEGALI